MNKNFLFLLSFIVVFFSDILCALSSSKNGTDLCPQKVMYVCAELEYLPSWCDTSWLTEHEDGIVPLAAPEMSDTINSQGKSSFFVRKVCSCGHMTRIELVQNETVEGAVYVTWEGENIRKVAVVDAGTQELHSDYFSYNKYGFPVEHIFEGQLTGKTKSKETYRKTFQYDSTGRMTSCAEQNGMTRTFAYLGENSYLVIDKTATSILRHHFLLDVEGIVLEDIEDDGTSLDIGDTHGVTWRRWKRRNVARDDSGLITTITTVGGFDPVCSKEVLLRIEEDLRSKDGDLLSFSIYNEKKELVSSSRGKEESIPSHPSTPEEGYQCIDGLGHLTYSSTTTLPTTTRQYDLFGNVTREQEEEINPIFAEYTARGKPFHITYADGTEEKILYSLDGNEISHTFRDGTVQTAERDERGRLLKTTRRSAGATRSNTTTYTYDGPNVRGWVTEEVSCAFSRDFFGRIVSISFSKEGEIVQEFVINHDACDRLIFASARGSEFWEWTRFFSQDGREIKTSYHNEGTVPNSVTTQEKYQEGVLRYKKEMFPDEQELIYTYDESGQLERVQHSSEGHSHEYVHVERGVKGNVQYETTSFPDKTTITEERTLSGNLSRRLWEQAGKKVLEESIRTSTHTSSVSIRQEAGDVRQFDWVFNEKKRLEAVLKNGKKAIEYHYDDIGHLINKRTAANKSVHYEWNAQHQVSRIFSDDQTVDYRFLYDAQGRISEAEDAVSSHRVVRNYDHNGQLIRDGEDGKEVCANYANLSLQTIVLPDGSSIIYEEGVIRREGTNPWSVKGNFSVARPLETVQPLCCRPSHVAYSDPLGTWSAQYSYDACNQLFDEQGEFSLDYQFDPFGRIQRLEGYSVSYDLDQHTLKAGPYEAEFDEDLNMVLFTNGDQAQKLSYDALGRLCHASIRGVEEEYRYDAFNRLQEIVTCSNGKSTSRKILWLGEIDLGAIVNGILSELKIPHPLLLTSPVAIEVEDHHYRVDCDHRGSITAVYDGSTGDLLEVYRFSAFGQLHQYGQQKAFLDSTPISPWLYCGKRWLPVACAYDFGERRYFPALMRWLESDPLGMIDGVDDRMYVRNNPILFYDAQGLWSWPIHWSSVKEKASNAWTQFKGKAHKTVTFSKTVFDWVQDLRSGFEELVFSSFDSLLISGRKTLHLMGFNLDRTCAGVYGESERHSKVRISFINGILNGAHDINSSLDIIYKTHGETPIHYVYVATDGFSGDAVRGAISKIGVMTLQVNLLVNLWRDLIEEMGGVQSGGIIIHYAHSLGATDTATALQLLTPEERRCLRITTFGSPTLMRETDDLLIDNYVSEKDGIPKIDFLRYRHGRSGRQKNIHFLPSDSSLPFVDHFISGKTYGGMLEILGQKFQEEFLLEPQKP